MTSRPSWGTDTAGCGSSTGGREAGTAWILEEIGKYEPITAGFIVDDSGKLAEIRILNLS